MEIGKIETTEQFNEVLEKETDFFLLKHSLTCPISASAKNQYVKYNEDSSIPCYILHVQESRPLSDFIAREYGIRHESPQVLLFNSKEPVWNASHGSITERNLKKVTTQ
ncbi:bacillithiol system redox-active protein YtxJ [Halobacillus yeomjeoni]|uniref:bacillithiol system redox-active protein YtxJ n=1 Tax=Halobacillus yeomjeoni TaxID=311194 RepID=UPI001CD7191F|nr:bacillithiol system redox-active protein YtxJ [Halobacillus yeomjeoni]MCA0982453.1 bacillithiol system redox-active protein YtxJ [Halobacillus yeomjeoni]